jgi:suppressor for copper-sensitivity B
MIGDGGRRGRRLLAALSGVSAAALTFCALGLASPSPAAAAEAASGWAVSDQGRVRLVAAASSTGGAAMLRLGLEFDLAPGWKIYWRSPGGAGYPPAVDWTGSSNLAATEIAWPAPHRFTTFGIDTYGYSDAVVLPIAVRPEKIDREVRLRAAVDYLTCSEICVPQQANLALDLPTSGAATGDGEGFAELIERYRARVPQGGTPAGMRIEQASVVANAPPQLALRLASDAALVAPDVFIEEPGLPDSAKPIAFAKPTIVRSGDGATELRLKIGEGGAVEDLLARSIRVTIVDGERSLEQDVVVAATVAPAALDGQSFRFWTTRFWAMLALAALGGFTLNFMPCVLPVLSIKLFGLMTGAGRPRLEIRLGFLAAAAGIVVSFLALAAVLIGFKSAGFAIGWGVQFQQPVFLVAMIALLTAFAGNLAGLFEIQLPSWLGALAAPAGAGKGGLLGDFIGGAFATLLATPCSAPFLGTAVGFALAGDALDILTIFCALGVGLAAPCLLVAAFPTLAALLPRPGRWMLRLRRALGVLIALTVLWLLTVLAAVLDLASAVAVGSLALAVVIFASMAASSRRRAVVAALLLLPATAFLIALARDVPAATGFAAEFEQQAIARHVAEGKIVFVDVTADWCLTCQVNDRLVLRSATVRDRLSRPDVVFMRADWTRPDASIAGYLRSFGRYGIPFNAVYGPAMPEGRPLLEILTVGEVLRSLAEAAPPIAAGPRSLSTLRTASSRPGEGP